MEKTIQKENLENSKLGKLGNLDQIVLASLALAGCLVAAVSADYKMPEKMAGWYLRKIGYAN